MSEHETVLDVIRRYDEALRDRNPEQQADFFTDAWLGANDMTRAELKDNIQEQIDEGSHKDNRFVVDDETSVDLDGDTATVQPVTLRASTGGGRFAFVMKREADGAWRCYSLGLMEVGDEAAKNARAVREKILNDPHRPGYHVVSPEGVAMPFDPNGAVYWKGRYHLFYIFQNDQLGYQADHWGHLSSTDLFHWRHHPTGLLDGMYSGNCFINGDGVPTMCYHQKGQGNAMAVALDDDLDTWQKLDVITPATKEGDEFHGRYASWDPYGWLEGDTYYAIFGGKQPGIAKCDSLSGHWQYVGDLLAHGVEGVALEEDVSCADLFHLDGKDVLLCISHRIGCRYYVGEWKNEQFFPETHAMMSWVDHAYFAPESLVDDQGRRIMWSWIMDDPKFGTRADQGWSGTMGLPRILSLGDDGLLRYDVPEEIERLRYQGVDCGSFDLSCSEQAVDTISGDSIELILDAEIGKAQSVGLKVCTSPGGEEETSIYYDAESKQLKVDTTRSGEGETTGVLEAAPFELTENESLNIRVFVDKSVVEVLVNGRQAIARRIYPHREESRGVRVFSRGGDALVRLKGWQMAASNAF